MGSKTESLLQLFTEWEQTIEGYDGKFVRDGIINENEYVRAKLKILFITKEPNNPEQTPGDYCEWWKEGLKYGFSNRLAEWSYGLLNNFPEFDTITKNSKSEAIKQIAIMNIKKIGGGAISIQNEILQHLKMNLSFINRQIEIIEPQIIIMCISWDQILRNTLFPDSVWAESDYCKIPIGRWNNIKVIDFYHPSSRNASSVKYNLLRDIANSNQFKLL